MGSIPLVVHIVTALCALVPFIVALATNEWYIVLSLSNSFKLGLHDECSEAGCEAISHDKLVDYALGSCERSAEDSKARFATTEAFAILTIIFCVIQAFVALAAWRFRLFFFPVTLFHIGVSVLTVIFAAITVIVFGASLESWLFCGKPYCSFIDNERQQCVSYVGYSYVLACCGVFLCFAALVAAIVSALTRPTEEQLDKIFSPELNVSTKTNNTKKASTTAIGGLPQLPEELRDGDWVFDSNTGYFWSEDRQLYFEPDTEQFYDPFSEAWFNPDTQLWYKPLEDEPDDIVR